jgi:hypothetical protein
MIVVLERNLKNYLLKWFLNNFKTISARKAHRYRLLFQQSITLLSINKKIIMVPIIVAKNDEKGTNYFLPVQKKLRNI